MLPVEGAGRDGESLRGAFVTKNHINVAAPGVNDVPPLRWIQIQPILGDFPVIVEVAGAVFAKQIERMDQVNVPLNGAGAADELQLPRSEDILLNPVGVDDGEERSFHAHSPVSILYFPIPMLVPLPTLNHSPARKYSANSVKSPSASSDPITPSICTRLPCLPLIRSHAYSRKSARCVFTPSAF